MPSYPRILPGANANPFIGTPGRVEEVAEARLESVVPRSLLSTVLNAIQQAHPYEEVAYYLQEIMNEHQEVGSGMLGELPESMDEEEFLLHVKENMGLKVIKHTHFRKTKIKTVAVCGGAGIFLLQAAKNNHADIFITSDVKYHEFFDAENQIIIADIGHYESEIYTKELIKEILSEKFSNIALYLTKVVSNPITYI